MKKLCCYSFPVIAPRNNVICFVITDQIYFTTLLYIRVRNAIFQHAYFDKWEGMSICFLVKSLTKALSWNCIANIAGSFGVGGFTFKTNVFFFVCGKLCQRINNPKLCLVRGYARCMLNPKSFILFWLSSTRICH